VDIYLRKRNRLCPEAYRGRKAYFLTLCARDRKRVFVDSRVVEAILGVLRNVCGRYSFGVYAYCFMPDHLHLIVTGEDDSSDLPGMVQAFKSLAPGAVRKIGMFDLWQKGYYDHVLRTGESMDSAARYVFMNPVRAGLVGRVEEWEFSGSFVFELGRFVAPEESFVPDWKRQRSGAEV
jgi:putative transposase